MKESELRYIKTPSADYARQPAGRFIDLATSTEYILCSTGHNPNLKIEISQTLPEGKISDFKLLLTFPAESYLPFGQISLVPALFEKEGEKQMAPAAIYSEARPQLNYTQQTLVYNGLSAFIYSYDLRLPILENALSFPLFDARGEFLKELSHNVWTKVNEAIILKASPRNSGLRLELFRGQVEISQGSKIIQQFIIQQADLPSPEIWQEILDFLKKSPEDITRLYQLLTQIYPFRNRIRPATPEEEEAIGNLL